MRRGKTFGEESTLFFSKITTEHVCESVPAYLVHHPKEPQINKVEDNATRKEASVKNKVALGQKAAQQKVMPNPPA